MSLRRTKAPPKKRSGRRTSILRRSASLSARQGADLKGEAFLADEESRVVLAPSFVEGLADELSARVVQADQASRQEFLSEDLRPRLSAMFDGAVHGLYDALAAIYALGRAIDGLRASERASAMQSLGCAINKSEGRYLALLKSFWPPPSERLARKAFQTKLSRYGQALDALHREDISPEQMVAMLHARGGIEGFAGKVRTPRSSPSEQDQSGAERPRGRSQLRGSVASGARKVLAARKAREGAAEAHDSVGIPERDQLDDEGDDGSEFPITMRIGMTNDVRRQLSRPGQALLVVEVIGRRKALALRAVFATAAGAHKINKKHNENKKKKNQNHR